jgi:dihydroflavonol-4-reductase
MLPAGIELAQGDVTEPAGLRSAAERIDGAFNCMGVYEQWLADEGLFERVNAQGAANVAAAAREAGARRLVHTSTFDVFHAERGGTLDESRLADYPKGTAYERSKQRAEELVLAERDGMEVVILNPSGVYGPTPSPTPSFENEIFEPAVRKRLPALPPGGTGYAYVEGVAAGHLLAAEKGADGERYILADGYGSFREIAEKVKEVAGRGRIPPTMPVPVAKGIASVGAGISRVIRRPPLLPRGQLHFLLWNAKPDASRAQRELGWMPTPLADGVRRTVATLTAG